MKHISLFLLLIFILTSCSRRPVKKEIIYEKPILLEKKIPGIIPETIIQKAEKKYGMYVRNRYEAYNAKLLELQNSSTEVKLEEINNFFNSVPYGDDIDVWGEKDYWATPLEFLGKDKGDCEDYVIAKYFALLNLGIESKKLYFSYVKSIHFTRTHLVLSYYKTPTSVPLILDNVNFNIFPADKRKDLIPIYHFNGVSFIRSRQRNENELKNQIRWNRLLQDIKKNKL